MDRLKRVNWYDFQKASRDDLAVDSQFHRTNTALAVADIAGTGIHLQYPSERIVFDSTDLSDAQAGWSNLSTFDGRGVLETPFICSDLQEGNQIAVEVSDSRLSGYATMTVTILGTDFEDNLYYEHVTVTENGRWLTHGHFKNVVNILFQNFLGNTDTSVDGRGSLRLEGTVLVTEASSYAPSRDLIVANQRQVPDVIFRDFKLYDPVKTLDQVLQEAIGSSRNVDDLNVNTTYALVREFEQGASTDTIYGQKFRMRGNNIQKATILVGLESGGTWSGSLTVGIRKLQTSVSDSCINDFVPENEIEFDPETEVLAEVSLTQSDLENQGVVLGADPVPVDFIFTGNTISNPSLSGLVDGEYLILTVRRTNSSTTGTLFLPEVVPYGTSTGLTGTEGIAGEDSVSGGGQLSVFAGGFWTDIVDHSMWYLISGDTLKVASGTAFDSGVRTISIKTTQDASGDRTQYSERGFPFASTSEDTQNYLVVETAETFSQTEAHPATGDPQAARAEDSPSLSIVLEAGAEELLEAKPDLIVVARAIDNNPRSNPTITGQLDYPGLAVGNVIDIINPSSDLMNHNVIGSIITPNILKPSIQYRIISQTLFTDGYGDINGDGVIDITDLELLEGLDGYSTDLSSGTVPAGTQQAAVDDGYISMAEIIRANLTANAVIDSADISALNAYLTSGTSFPNGGSEYFRMRIELEPLTNQLASLDSEGRSTLRIEDADTDLLSTFSAPVEFQIDFWPVWYPEQVELLDLRRFVNGSTLDFSIEDLQSTPESGGKNHQIVSGDLYLQGNVKNLDGSFHRLDYERCLIDLELPDGSTEAEINIFDVFVKSIMQFSDGTFVPASALTDSQVFFEVKVSSFAKNLGFGVDGYVDYSDVGDSADEAVGTFIDQSTGLMRIRAYNIVNNALRPEIRTRINVVVNLKKAGWRNMPQTISALELSNILTNV